MKIKTCFLGIFLLGGIVYLVAHLAALITTSASTTAIALSVCTLVASVMLSVAALLSIFVKNRKHVLAFVWLSCLIFSVFFFTESIVTHADAISSFNSTLDNLPEMIAGNTKKTLQNNINASNWIIVGSAFALAGSVAFFIFQTVKTYFRPVKAE